MRLPRQPVRLCCELRSRSAQTAIGPCAAPSCLMPEPPAASHRAALITGGGQRIGRAIALALVQRGHAVVVQVRHSRAAADRLVAEIIDGGGRAAVVEADLADHDAVLRLVPAAAAAVGPLTL